MRPRAKASVLWGVVGALSFLVLVQGYELATDSRHTFTVKFGVAVLVAITATAVTYLADDRLH